MDHLRDQSYLVVMFTIQNDVIPIKDMTHTPGMFRNYWVLWLIQLVISMLGRVLNCLLIWPTYDASQFLQQILYITLLFV